MPPRTPSSAVMMNFELGVLDAAGEAFRREAAEHHGMNGADARAGEHGVGRLGDHRQVDGDPVTLLDAVRLQHVGELAHPLVQLAIGDLLFLGRVVALPDDGDLVAARRQMAVDAVGGNIERAVLEPFDRHVAGAERGVLHLRVRLDPVDAAADLAPKALRVGDRALVQRADSPFCRSRRGSTIRHPAPDAASPTSAFSHDYSLLAPLWAPCSATAIWHLGEGARLCGVKDPASR